MPTQPQPKKKSRCTIKCTLWVVGIILLLILYGAHDKVHHKLTIDDLVVPTMSPEQIADMKPKTFDLAQFLERHQKLQPMAMKSVIRPVANIDNHIDYAYDGPLVSYNLNGDIVDMSKIISSEKSKDDSIEMNNNNNNNSAGEGAVDDIVDSIFDDYHKYILNVHHQQPIDGITSSILPSPQEKISPSILPPPQQPIIDEHSEFNSLPDVDVVDVVNSSDETTVTKRIKILDTIKSIDNDINRLAATPQQTVISINVDALIDYNEKATINVKTKEEETAEDDNHHQQNHPNEDPKMRQNYRVAIITNLQLLQPRKEGDSLKNVKEGKIIFGMWHIRTKKIAVVDKLYIHSELDELLPSSPIDDNLSTDSTTITTESTNNVTDEASKPIALILN